VPQTENCEGDETGEEEGSLLTEKDRTGSPELGRRQWPLEGGRSPAESRNRQRQRQRALVGKNREPLARSGWRPFF
jgi:hypothetical protein